MILRSVAICAFLLAALMFGQPSWSLTVTIRVTDSSGAERLDKILIIVRSLEGKGEITRGLTTVDGEFSVATMAPGLYQAISLYPYGYWHSAVREFVVTNKDTLVEFRLKGSVVDQVEIPERQVSVRVIDRDGNAVHGAQIVARDVLAKFMKFSKTDEQGRAKLSIPCGDSQISIIYNNKVATRDLKMALEKQAATGETMCRIVELPSNAQGGDIVLPVPMGPE